MSGFSTSSYVSKSELALELLRLVIPGKHDPSLDDVEIFGPNGGVKIRQAPGAFLPHSSFISSVVNQHQNEIRHGWRRHHRSNTTYTKKGGAETKPRTTAFYADPVSPTLPRVPRVARILSLLTCATGTHRHKDEEAQFINLKKLYRKQGAKAALEYIDLLIMTDRLEGK